MRNMLMPLMASLRAISCGVDIMIAPVSEVVSMWNKWHGNQGRPTVKDNLLGYGQLGVSSAWWEI